MLFEAETEKSSKRIILLCLGHIFSERKLSSYLKKIIRLKIF